MVVIMRSCWQGRSDAYDGPILSLAAGVWCVPTPPRDVPVLLGASTASGLRRAGRIGNGFVGFALAKQLDIERIAVDVHAARLAARDHGRESAVDRIVYRVSGRAEEVTSVVPVLREVGVTEIVVSVGWSDTDGPRRAAETVLAAS
jgi:alkanesulfonate monooxygenase SsuD/methylene tetrahydromethanopterin reductase-like flavin-dependent oxidoreductase (luciferase family)